MTTPDLLVAYDTSLRGENEALTALSTVRHGPLYLSVFSGGRGFVSYRPFEADAHGVRQLVQDALAHFQADASVGQVEWKTRGHDALPGLPEALVEAGFVPQETESIMLGEASKLTVDVDLPKGVSVRSVTDPDELADIAAMVDGIFNGTYAVDFLDLTVQRVAAGLKEVWAAFHDGRPIGAGDLQPVDGTPFAGLWGGAVAEPWRGRGVYRAITAGRARAALARGVQYLHSDSLETSRPILERSGLVKVSTTTPYEWHRSPQS